MSTQLHSFALVITPVATMYVFLIIQKEMSLDFFMI